VNINPVAFNIGSISVRWYGILMSVAVVIGTYLAMREARRQGVSTDRLLDLVTIGVPVSWIGARIYYVIFNWDYYSKHLTEIPKVWEGGLAIHGGILTAIAFGIWFARKHAMSFWQLADIAAPSFILGQAIGRWGNFFNQEAYGYPTDLPWAMYIDGAYRHPTFLYESLWNFAIFSFLMWRKAKFKLQGNVFLTWIGLYSLGRFFIEGLRTDSLMLGPLRMAQVISLIFLAATVFVVYWRRSSRVTRKF